MESCNENPPQSSFFSKILNSREIGAFVLLLLCLVGLYYFSFRGMRFFVVPSESMEPTLYPSDMIITLKHKRYHRGDIVVWYEDGEYVVKRIIGLPGDTISVIDGALFINGKYAAEPYMREPMRYYIEAPVRIPEGRFFFLGDNRNQSDDSSVGFIADTPLSPKRNPATYLGYLDTIVGRVHFIYYPYNRLGSVPSYPLINIAGQ